ncbi:TetR/AcrR family transcriptional regulator [Nocardia panacis]|uniref:TetR/AcrR family transcriptional regulator n=2 Tax=Nocardia panacis TaxID=2340916 RepID=A0A3A4JWU6_9NOCA|nr:TetR/AcrR family transcriptional regulator [Nocardia panacis]
MNRGPREANVGTRDRLIEAGIRLLEQYGPEALQARRIAAEVGASTMAVYTHFNGMGGLMQSVVAEALTRFGAALAAAERSDDPVADFFRMGMAYRDYAMANPQRYRLMFGLTPPWNGCDTDIDITTQGIPGDATFAQLTEIVERMIAAGRLHGDSSVLDLAGRIWALTHGVVMLELAGYFGAGDRAITDILLPASVDLIVGMGDERGRAEQSLHSALSSTA